MEISDSSVPSPACEACIYGKQNRHISRHPRERSSEKLGIIHTDLFGPITPPSIGGARYGITFTDDHSRYTWIRFLKQKSETYDAFKSFKALVENHSGKQIKALHGDNGGEFTSNDFQEFLRKHGIQWQPTVPYTPEQNGVAERKNRTILELVRTIIHQASLDKRLWAELASTVVYLRNRVSTSTHNAVPYQLWAGSKPNVAHIRVLGATAYHHIPTEKGRKKLDAVSERCILVGYESSNIYRLYNSTNGKVIRARDVVIDENTSSTVNTPSLGTEAPADNVESIITSDVYIKQSTTPQTQVEQQVAPAEQVGPGDELSNSMSSTWRPTVSSLQRQSQQNTNDSDSEDELSKPYPLPTFGRKALIAATPIYSEPKTYREAINGPESRQWKAAMDEEYASLRENETWTLEKLPHNREALGGRWVYKRKLDAVGQISRYKARYVVRGFEQIYGIDYDLTFAPVVKSTSYRLLFALAAQQDFELEQMDIKTAFLYGKLNESIYMEQPKGYEDGSDSVCALKRALYGLKQSPRVWYQTLSHFLHSLGFEHIDADYSLFKNSAGIIIAVYVDDLLIAGPSMTAISELKAAFTSRFRMSDLGACQFYLGMEIVRDRRNRTLWLTQRGYLKQVLEKFGCLDLNPTATPMEAGLDLVKSDQSHEAPKSSIIKFQSAVGSLLYASTITRADLAFAVNRLGQFASNPNQTHEQALKRIFRYINGTLAFGLRYTSSSTSTGLLGYSDADWAGCKITRRSTGGYCFFWRASLISWSTKRQATVALSSCEAEYMALTQATKESIWLRSLLTSFGLTCEGPITIKEDNNSAIDLARDPTFHARVKHIDIQHHFVREKVESNEIEVEHIPSRDMIADCLTKPLPRPLFDDLRNRLGVLPLQIEGGCSNSNLQGEEKVEEKEE